MLPLEGPDDRETPRSGQPGEDHVPLRIEADVQERVPIIMTQVGRVNQRTTVSGYLAVETVDSVLPETLKTRTYLNRVRRNWKVGGPGPPDDVDVVRCVDGEAEAVVHMGAPDERRVEELPRVAKLH